MEDGDTRNGAGSAGLWRQWPHVGSLAHAVGIGQATPAQSSTLGWLQTEEPAARKLAEVECEAHSRGERFGLWGRAEARKSLAEPSQVWAGTAAPFGGGLGQLLAAWPVTKGTEAWPGDGHPGGDGIRWGESREIPCEKQVLREQ